MPAIVSVKVLAARDLPVMDRSSELTDAFVEIRLGQITQRTEIYRKSLNPFWDSPWFKFHTNDEELQDEPLTIKVMDYDQYSAHDAIGRIYLSLTSLINSLSGTPSLDGWFPIYDTLHGVRGELHIKVSIEFIKNQHKPSSSEVMFFTGHSIPEGYNIVSDHGFLEELVVNIDPEYQWIDKIRPPRASNESRQQVFLKLSGELQRKIGKKALDAGGNAIIGYCQSFDLEGESGIVGRGIGTCVTLSIIRSLPMSPSQNFVENIERALEDTFDEQLGTTPPDIAVLKNQFQRIRHTSSSDSDGIPSSPTKLDFDASAVLSTSAGSGGGYFISNLGPTEFPFYTLTSFPTGCIKSIAGVVSARSVKLLDDINNPDEPETRDAWWHEIRSEIRSHYRAMYCNAVIGYSENTSICDNLCILSATGTAAVVTSFSDPPLTLAGGLTNRPVVTPLSNTPDVFGSDHDVSSTENLFLRSFDDGICGPCHVTYPQSKSPFDVKLSNCHVCKVKQVPSVLLSTVDPPPGLLTRGEGCLLQTRICKLKRKGKGEENASHISSMLPFIEYNLHGRLLNKLKCKGMNSLFGMNIQLTVGDAMIIGVITGTAMYLESLPQPSNFPLSSQDSFLAKQQEENRSLYQLEKSKLDLSGVASPKQPSTPDASEDVDGRDTTFFVEVEETLKGDDTFDVLSDHGVPPNFYVSNLSYVPGIDERFIVTDQTKVVTVVSKQYIDGRQASHDHQCTLFFSKLLQQLLFQARDMHPCMITNIKFQVDLPDDDEIQVTVVSVATKLKSSINSTSLEVPPLSGGNLATVEFPRRQLSQSSTTPKDDLPLTTLSPLNEPKECYCVKHLGLINLFLIRETTSMKELGGMTSFLHTFICEAHNVARSLVQASGGQALLGYQMKQCVVIENQHKNQGQCLLNITGNVVQLKKIDLNIDQGIKQLSDNGLQNN